MRDYADLCARLDRSGDHLMSEASEAIRELKVMADKMTALGADLESQVAEQLEPDIFWVQEDDVQYFVTLEDFMKGYRVGQVVALGRAKSLPSQFARREEDGTITTWYAGDEPDGVL